MWVGESRSTASTTSRDDDDAEEVLEDSRPATTGHWMIPGPMRPHLPPSGRGENHPVEASIVIAPGLRLLDLVGMVGLDLRSGEDLAEAGRSPRPLRSTPRAIRGTGDAASSTRSPRSGGDRSVRTPSRDRSSWMPAARPWDHEQPADPVPPTPHGRHRGRTTQSGRVAGGFHGQRCRSRVVSRADSACHPSSTPREWMNALRMNAL